MARTFALAALSAATAANAYFLIGSTNILSTQRMDPIVNPGYGQPSAHAHTIIGGSNFQFDVTTDQLRQSQCTTIGIDQDHSSYWFPSLYFEWANGSVSEVQGGNVIYYLFPDDPSKTTPFPDNFRMISGDPYLRSYDPTNIVQTAVTFLCLDFNGVTTKFNSFPTTPCASGIRTQINFPSCWDGVNTDSPDHKSHVAYRSVNADTGDCTDPKFPKSLPRVFMEFYTESHNFDQYRSQALNPDQPYVFSTGDRTGYGYHADYVFGWEAGVIEKVIEGCNCNIYGDPSCCVDKGIFTKTDNKKCRITPSLDENVNGMLPKLPGNNPITGEGARAAVSPNNIIPNLLTPVYVYQTDQPSQVGKSGPNPIAGGAAATSAATSSSAATSAGAGTSSSAATSAAAGTSSGAAASSVHTTTASTSAVHTTTAGTSAVHTTTASTSAVHTTTASTSAVHTTTASTSAVHTTTASTSAVHTTASNSAVHTTTATTVAVHTTTATGVKPTGTAHPGSPGHGHHDYGHGGGNDDDNDDDDEYCHSKKKHHKRTSARRAHKRMTYHDDARFL